MNKKITYVLLLLCLLKIKIHVLLSSCLKKITELSTLDLFFYKKYYICNENI